MTPALIAAGFATLSLTGQAPADFAFRAPLTLQSAEAIHRVTVPTDVYREARADLADLRVFNAKGESLPLAFAGPQPTVRTSPEGVALAQFPVFAPASPKSEARFDVTVRARPDGTLVSVQDRTKSRAVRTPAAYLLDASQLKEPLRALRFDWETAPGSEVVKVNVESSEDLREWRSVAARAPLVRVEHAGQSLVQREVDLRSHQARYYRVTWEGGPFTLRSVHAEPVRSVKPAVRPSMVVRPKEIARDGRITYDIGARLPVEAVRAVFAEQNTVAPYRIEARDTESAAWGGVASATFHRVVRDGVELVSTPLEVGRQPARYWRLEPTNPASVPPTPPLLEVHWRPADLVFVARGQPPFELAFGNRDAQPSVVVVSQLIPRYEPYAEWKVPAANVGESRRVRAEQRWQKVVGDASPRRVALWGILFIAVLILGFMAVRLLRQPTKPGEQ